MGIPGQEQMLKLFSVLAEKGIVAFLNPEKLRKIETAKTDIEVERIVRLAQAHRDELEILDGKKVVVGNHKLLTLEIECRDIQAKSDGNAPIESPIPQSAVQLVQRREFSDAVRREVNLTNAILNAAEELSQNKNQPSTEDPEDDWLFRWREYASEVSHDTMQQLWGRVLAGEIKSPGTFSLRTLSFLRNLMQDEAKLIERVLPLIIDDSIWSEDPELLKKLGISFDDLLHLQYLGVVDGVGADLVLKFDQSDNRMISHNRVLIITHTLPEWTIELSIISLTQLGSEISKLGIVEADEMYLRSIAEHIAFDDFSVTIVDHIPGEPSTMANPVLVSMASESTEFGVDKRAICND